MIKNHKKLLLNLAKILVTIVLLVVVILTVDIQQVWQVISRASWIYLGLAWLLYQVGIFIRASRWQELLRANQVVVPYTSLVKLYYVGTFFNSFLPTGFGGDVVKMYELSRVGAKGEVSVSTVLADRVLGLATLFVMALVVLPFSFQLVPPYIMLVLLGIISVFGLVVILLFSRNVMAYLTSRITLVRRFMERPRMVAFTASLYRYSWRSIRKAVLASFLFNASIIAVYYLLGLAVGVRISILYYFIFIPIISSVMVLPISVSGLGVREGGYVLLFGRAGVAQPQAVAMSLLFYVLNLVTGAGGGILYLLQNALDAREKHKT